MLSEKEINRLNGRGPEFFPDRTRCVMMQRKVSAVFMTAMAMLMIVGYCHGRDERSNACEQIRRLNFWNSRIMANSCISERIELKTVGMQLG